MSAFILFMAFLVLQRLSELVLARRNAKWMRARGAIEAGQGHYKFAILLHTAFMISLVLEVTLLHRRPAMWWWAPFLLFVLAQALRYWSIVSLGRFWNTRILVLPGHEIMRRGPYRLLRHPNYAAVVVEFLVIPLVFQAYVTCVAFTVLNATFLVVRIPTEEKALRGP